jgi:hypothetical protein
VARCTGDGRPRRETVFADLPPLLDDVMATGAEIAVGLSACRNRPLGT